MPNLTSLQPFTIVPVPQPTFLHKNTATTDILSFVRINSLQRASDLLTQVLHFYILLFSVTPRWVSLNHSPSQLINSSKIHVQNPKQKYYKKVQKSGDSKWWSSNQNEILKLVQKPNVIPTQICVPVNCSSINN